MGLRTKAHDLRVEIHHKLKIPTEFNKLISMEVSEKTCKKEEERRKDKPFPAFDKQLTKNSRRNDKLHFIFLRMHIRDIFLLLFFSAVELSPSPNKILFVYFQDVEAMTKDLDHTVVEGVPPYSWSVNYSNNRKSQRRGGYKKALERVRKLNEE